MKAIINFFKSLFKPKKEEIFCETVKREASKTKKARNPKAKVPTKKSEKNEN